MKTNTILFYVLAGVFFVAAAVYTGWTWADQASSQLAGTSEIGGAVSGQPEWVGTVTLTLSGVLALFIAVWLTLANRSIGGTLPEDRESANIDDGDPELGYFSPWSWWPVTLAFGLALMFLGLAAGVWLAIIGGPIVLIAVIGWQFEYYRGNFGR